MKITKIMNINNEFEVVIEFEFNGEILQAKTIFNCEESEIQSLAEEYISKKRLEMLDNNSTSEM